MTPDWREWTSAPPSSSAVTTSPIAALHERRAAEEDGPLLAHDDALVAHRGDIGAARGARAHDDRDLGDPLRRHVRLVVERSAEVRAVGKYVVLKRQERPARIDEVDARQMVLGRDVLGPEVLLHRHREVGPALDGGVVGDDDALDPAHPADPGDEPCGWGVAVVHVPRRELRELEEGGARVEELAHPVAGEELAACDVAPARSFAAPLLDLRDPGPEILDEGGHRPRVLAELRRPRVDAALDDGHRLRLPPSRSRRPRLQAVSRKSSRPMSIRRISEVPAPIS